MGHHEVHEGYEVRAGKAGKGKASGGADAVSSAWVLAGVVLLASLAFSTGCQTRAPEATPGRVQESSARRQSAGPREPLVKAARDGEEGGWQNLAASLCEADFELADLEEVLAGLAGREERLLEALLDRARFLAQDVSPVLRRTARAVGESGRWPAWRSAVREISGRECCMTRRFLAATLQGLADGLEAAGVGPQNEPETALRLQELGAHHDPGVACGAARVAKLFSAGR